MAMCPNYCRIEALSRDHRRRTLQSRLGTLLCLVAFALRLVLPVVHIWETATHEATAFAPALGQLSPLTTGQNGATLAQPQTAPQCRSHNAVLCSVCQVLSHVRHYLSSQAATLGVPIMSSQLVATPAAPALLHFLVVSPSRAPPFSS